MITPHEVVLAVALFLVVLLWVDVCKYAAVPLTRRCRGGSNTEDTAHRMLDTGVPVAEHAGAMTPCVGRHDTHLVSPNEERAIELHLV